MSTVAMDYQTVWTLSQSIAGHKYFVFIVDMVLYYSLR